MNTIKTSIRLAVLSFLALVVTFLGACSSAPPSPSLNAQGSLTNNKLIACPSSPNCVQSEDKNDAEHYFSAIKFPTSMEFSALKKNITEVIKEMDGKLVENTQVQNSSYISATFTSMIFRFVDDFELRIDLEKGLIHLRSASRTGHSDMGVNMNRASEFQELLSKKNKS
jgi:uncharacterized protein (DUF1499 family)